MLKNTISPEGQFPARVSFFPDPASKFKDPGPMTEELAHGWGVCISAEESDRRWGVSALPQSFSTDGAEGAGERSRQCWGLGQSSCQARVELVVTGFSASLIQSKARTSP